MESFFFDGVLEASNTTTMGAFDNPISGTASIGHLGGNIFPHEGNISFVAVWNRQLGHEEVAVVSAYPEGLVSRELSRRAAILSAGVSVVTGHASGLVSSIPLKSKLQGLVA